ncbi:sigma-54-dependent transcriptional regulator [Pseudochryseolinea flava]|uniref:Sigma-54-dependent Fis family transcriptional regulator n=1 Tax=Pseudochryseolinea flava TaxID=2059302 RepID=A0A364Y0H3_9BACT|nr:sigma-54 dependent transcriptional regulator [Pseudochryseolinea flava]RAW00169.1 sigma-54-dependent Fis family transcriptional regulator [Pseudochryseolinea flava]
MAEILLIEDDLTFTRILEGFLSKHGFQVTSHHNGKEGLKAFASKSFKLVLLDYRLPDTTGLDILQDIKKEGSDVPVIIMTSFSDIRTAVKAIKVGAFEYITKPVNPDELLMVVRQALKNEKIVTPEKKTAVDSKQFVEGTSVVAKQLHEHVRLVAPTNMSVVIEGESGTGKENVARSIHRLSQRAKGPFVAVDCGALSKDLAASELFGHVKGAFTGAMNDKNGQFLEANGGTLFLDEVGNLSYEVQVKLLRAIQERIITPIGSNKEIHVDVRIITATNDDLAESVKRGQFREDLYHRINEFMLRVPPLRERGDDLIEFLNFFRSAANQELGRKVVRFDDQVMNILKNYDWPGNLRELRNVVKRSVLLTQGDHVLIETLPIEMLDAVRNPAPKTPTAPIYDLKALQESQEKEMIIKTLQEVRYNKSKAARILNIDRKTLYLKMEKYNIE